MLYGKCSSAEGVEAISCCSWTYRKWWKHWSRGDARRHHAEGWGYRLAGCPPSSTMFWVQGGRDYTLLFKSLDD